MGEKRRSRAVRLIVLVLVVLVALAVGVFVTKRQPIQDHFAAQRFEPSPAVSHLVDDLDLTDAGERVFYASQPTLDGSQHFNEQCAEVNQAEGGHVLGCYSSDRIHLFEVTDERVSGIVEVTAAHELLHATFARMRPGDRAWLSEKLRRLYATLASEDPELEERMAMYTHLSDAGFANELHSVLGSEVHDLPDWLEEHYAAWFQSRERVVASYDEYQAVFDELEDRAASLKTEMTDLRADIEQRKADYDAAVDAYNNDAAAFKARNEAYEFSESPAEFERIKSGLQTRRDELEETLETLQTDIDRYNALRDELEELSSVNTELEEQLDSALAPVTTRPES